MASATAINIKTVPTKTIGAILVAGTAYGLSRLDVRSAFVSIFTGPGSTSRIIAILFVLANIKNFPYVWHVRVWNAIFKHFLISPRRFTVETGGPAALFQPVISSSRSPITECDYNLHKSNSTYFADLDVTRTHLVSSLFRRGIQSLQSNPGQVISPDGKRAKGRWSIMLGAVECSFKKEIKPYEGYEMWSRLLCWDRKWIYIVTHFVKKGAVTPAGYTLEDGSSFFSGLFGKKKGARKSKNGAAVEPNGTAVPEVPHKAIFASAISKYVIKLGRLTVHPEVMLNLSGVLPPRPGGGWNTMSGTEGAVNGAHESNVDAAFVDSEWTWEKIVAENERGLKYAEHFAALDGLHGEFTGEDRPAIGEYRDLLW